MFFLYGFNIKAAYYNRAVAGKEGRTHSTVIPASPAQIQEHFRLDLCHNVYGDNYFRV